MLLPTWWQRNICRALGASCVTDVGEGRVSSGKGEAERSARRLVSTFLPVRQANEILTHNFMAACFSSCRANREADCFLESKQSRRCLFVLGPEAVWLDLPVEFSPLSSLSRTGATRLHHANFTLPMFSNNNPSLCPFFKKRLLILEIRKWLEMADSGNQPSMMSQKALILH